MMPAMLSIEVAAIAMPNRPASLNETKIAMQTKSTGQAVLFMLTPMPAMMLVA